MLENSINSLNKVLEVMGLQKFLDTIYTFKDFIL